MTKRFTRTRVLTFLAVVSTAIFAASAFAYFSASGVSDDQTVAIAANGPAVNITMTGLSSATPLSPGDTVGLNYTVSNPGTSAVTVERIVENSIAVDAAHVSAGCSVSDFSIDPRTYNASIPAGGQLDADPVEPGIQSPQSNLMFANNGDQDACRGAELTVSVKAVPTP